MRLENNSYADEACLELLISSCPFLEDFSFVRLREWGSIKVLRVHSKTLNSLSIETGDIDYDDLSLARLNEGHISVRVLINAPRLKYLNLCDRISECETISDLGSLTKVNLGRRCDFTSHFFTRISEVRDMKIAGSTFSFILQETKTLPRFCNLSRLEADLHFWIMDLLLMFLEICPNLRSLTLDMSLSVQQTRFMAVPQCLLSSLEFVEIAGTFGGLPAEMELVRYFAENSVVLKKLSLRLKSPLDDDYSVVLRELLPTLPTLEVSVALRELLLTLPTLASACEIVVF